MIVDMQSNNQQLEEQVVETQNTNKSKAMAVSSIKAKKTTKTVKMF